MTLRPYQRKAVDNLWKWFEYNSGNPCISLPTGSGKSHVIAAICQEAIEMYPPTRILMLTHVKELIAQNAEKLLLHYPDAPLGIYSAGLGVKELNQITFAGIQSIRNKEIGHIDLCIIDEAHLISHNDTGVYRSLINSLQLRNPYMKVIGLTATPFRLGHGLITDDPAIFDDIIEPVSIDELQSQGYLARLKSKVTHRKLSVDGVHKRGGEYIESELIQKLDTSDNNERVVNEVLRLAEDRKHWLFFCTGVSHAEHVRDILFERGIIAETITGKTKKSDRDRIIESFKRGEIQAITNANVLTTGFDYPDIDLIVMMRPTMSPGLYMQMAGRGLRLKSHTDHCLVLDFAGIVEQHGPITMVNTPRKPGEGVAPSKICPKCDEIVHASIMVCPECGYKFPPPPKEDMTLHDDDIQGDGLKHIEIKEWSWAVQESRKSGIEMVRVTYYPVDMTKSPVNDFLCLKHGGYAGYKALETLRAIADNSGGDINQETMSALCDAMALSLPPTEIACKKDGRYLHVVNRVWGERKNIFSDDDDNIIF